MRSLIAQLRSPSVGFCLIVFHVLFSHGRHFEKRTRCQMKVLSAKFFNTSSSADKLKQLIRFIFIKDVEKIAVYLREGKMSYLNLSKQLKNIR